MIRLVLTIVVVLYIAFNLAMFISEEVDMAMFRSDGEAFFTGQYRGTFTLLDEAIVGRSGKDLQAVLNTLQGDFKTPVRLEVEHEIDLPEPGRQIIGSGAIYLHDQGDSASLYRQSVIDGRVWSLPVVTTRVEERIAHVTGTLALLRRDLSSIDENERASRLEELTRYYDVPMALTSMTELDLDDKDAAILDAMQIAVQRPLESGELFLARLDDGEAVIQFGPIDYPASFEDNNRLDTIILATIALTCFLLWMWPLWRDLKRLNRASVDIGNGELSTRVRSHPASLIKPVLDSFNGMALRTEDMVESQRALTDAVSHELRTPLARMMFDLQMAQDADNAPDRSRHLNSLEINVAELNTLVDELLTYARQERVETPLELETMSLDDMKHWLETQVARARHGRESVCRIALDFDATGLVDDSITFSPRLMAHALSNTLQNAVRFAEERIAVQLRSGQTDWVLSVEDDGIGIPEDQRERVFEPFSRLDESRQRGSGGFGMGLSIVRKIAQWHHGNAAVVASSTGIGTRVEIRWPVGVYAG